MSRSRPLLVTLDLAPVRENRYCLRRSHNFPSISQGIKHSLMSFYLSQWNTRRNLPRTRTLDISQALFLLSTFQRLSIFQMAASSSDFVFYHYRPSLSAAAVFVAIFGLSTLLHSYQMLRKKTIYMIPLVIGGTCEAVGYVGRVVSHVEAPHYKLPAYILQSLLLLIAPAFVAASIYTVLGRIVTAVDGESRCPIERKYLTVTFVLGDITSFMTQSTGMSFLTMHSALLLHDRNEN